MEPNALARLKRVADKQTTTLTHYGRKTGKPHEVTIWFVLDHDKFHIGTASVNRQWVRNVQKTPKIRLSIAGENFEAKARFLTDRAAEVQDGWPLRRPPYLLETSRPGVFAVGDIRSESVKRVASAVGEGSMVIQFVHKVLVE